MAAVVIVVASLWYTNTLVRKIAQDERNKARLWAEAIQRKASLVRYTNELFSKISTEEKKKIELWADANREMLTKELPDYTFVLKVITDNTTIPVIIADQQGKALLSRNIDTTRSKDPGYMRAQMDSMRQQHEPIEIVLFNGQKNYLYYKDSRLFSELKTVFDGLIRSFIQEVAVNSASVPVIYTDSTRKNVIAFGNLDSVKMAKPDHVRSTLEKMGSENAPIEVDLGGGEKNYIFYQESFLLTQLRYYPYVQFFIIGLFLLIAYMLFSTARKAEQNQVWVGMAKETAHQLGTPLSSLLAWLEFLRMKGVDDKTISDMRQDVKRLETITERFSKIGSMPVLERHNLPDVLNRSVDYIRTRTSRNVSITVNTLTNFPVQAPLNVPLFEWVIENICKNAVDAMDGSGRITIDISDQTQFAYIDITDTGKGIPKSKYQTIFEPGYTTKDRGWGLGLSLARRIIENYHSGKIFVKSSEPGKGTTFRIVLNK